MMIKTLDATNQWPYHIGGKPRGRNKRKQSGKDGNEKKKVKEDDPDDITAFCAEMKSMNKRLSALQANQSGTATPPPPKAKADSKYKLTKHFGPSCYYKMREDLEQFISGNLGKDIVEMPTGTIWRWCDTCSHMGSQDTAHHHPKHSKSNLKVQVPGKPTAPQPSTQTNSTPIESNSRPSSPPPPQANTAAIHAVEDNDEVEVEDFLAGCD